jgi:hypothetical protein
MIWVPLALLVWCAAAIMLLARRTRPMARSLAVAMAATFPGVLFLQLLAAPVVVTILVTMRVFWKTLEPGPSTTTENPFVIAASIAGALLVLGVMAGMSAVGFCEGWRIGWEWAKGRPFRDVIKEGLLARLAKRFVWRSSHVVPSA